ncbi:MAG: phenylalanine--tRNA ligase subunit beta, partial [Gammaproteobacteria bacterium RIFOXYB2_FULL_38_6]
MQISTTWLKNWIDLKLNANELAQKLSLSGLEAASIEKAAGDFEKVVVGQIVECSQHPDADKLKICRVDVGEKENLQIICGAPNARQGIKVAVALMDAVLPGNFKIKKAKLRGVESFGMMCSTRELGLSDDHAGIIELESDAPVGKDFREYWQLDDVILDLEITPNRGDCLSLQGVAREIAAIENISFHPIKIKSIPVNISDTRKVILKATQKAPRYAGRTIKNINAKAKTPLYIQENLRRCGIRVIHPVVDVLNYVMLALGQPMHAFDLNCLKGNIIVRDAQLNEKIKLLDGSEILLQENTLVIADSEKPQAIAGVMGGEESGVTENTTDIFLESAFFVPEFISQAVRDYHLHSDSSYRFERGVDFNLQIEAM